MTPVTGLFWPIRSPWDEALICTPSPRLPAGVNPLASRPMSFPWTVTNGALRVTPAFPALTSESDLRIEPSEPPLNWSPWVPPKSTVTTGAPAKSGAVVPSIETGLVIAGSDVAPTRIVPGTLKLMTSNPGAASAWRIAWRREPGPESLRLVTAKVARS